MHVLLLVSAKVIGFELHTRMQARVFSSAKYGSGQVVEQELFNGFLKNSVVHSETQDRFPVFI